MKALFGSLVHTGLLLFLALLIGGCHPVDPRSPEEADSMEAAAGWTLDSGGLTARIDPEDGRVLGLAGTMEGADPIEFLLDPEKIPPARLGTLQIGWRDSDGKTRLARLPGSDAEVKVQKTDGGIRSEWSLADPGLRVISEIRSDPELPDQLTWEIELACIGQTQLRLGEVGFPFPANTDYYSGFDQTDQGLKRLFESRVYQHRHIGGRSSYLLCRRLRGDFPALILTCGDGTELELSYLEKADWEGVPVLLAASETARERLGMKEEWLEEPSSLVLEPGTPRQLRFQLRLLKGRPHYQGADDLIDRGVIRAVAQSGGVGIQAIPGMVIPRGEDWLTILSTANRVRQVRTEPAVELSRPFGPTASCLAAQFPEAGPATLVVEGESGARSRYHLNVIDPPRELIRRRAAFIASHQVHRKDGDPLDGAILVWDRLEEKRLHDPESYWGGGGYEGGICDAMFLAEKNAVLPDPGEIEVLEEYTDRFLLRRLQNPGTAEVAWFFPGGVTPYKIGRPYNYAHVVGFHRAMYRIGRHHDALSRRKARDYLMLALRTTETMLERSWHWHLTHVGLMGGWVFYQLPADLRAEGLVAEADRLERRLRWRAEELLSREWPYSAEPLYDTTGYEEIYFAGKLLQRFDHMARTLRCAMAQKSLTPTWFWNGSDKRYWDAMEENPAKGYYGTDMGETCFHYTATLTAQVGLDDYTHPRFFREDAVLARSYAGLLGVLTLIHPDGSASMCYTPDPNSNHFGYNRYSGDVGLGLTGHLRGSTAVVHDLRLGRGQTAPVGYGCRVSQEAEDVIVEPWDAVQQRIQWPSLEYDLRVDRGRIRRARLSRSKAAIQVELENDTPYTRPTRLTVQGLWGASARVKLDGVDQKRAATIGPRGLELDIPFQAGQQRTVELVVP